MHIPDGFLAPPVWATFDVIALPAVGWIAKRAERGTDVASTATRVPVLGLMGAFVFAAQMINVPIGAGTSSHLLGGTLLAVLLGPASAALVMTTVLILQAMMFQDGGVLALGANIFNMALAGVGAGYLPCFLGGRKGPMLFLGGLLSVCVSGGLALSQLLLSGIAISPKLLMAASGLFLLAGCLEGAITVAVVRAILHLRPALVHEPARLSPRGWLLVSGGMLVTAFAVTWMTSTYPDGLQHLGNEIGLQARPAWLHAPFAGYEAALPGPDWIRKSAASVAGLALAYTLCSLAVMRSRSARLGRSPRSRPTV